MELVHIGHSCFRLKGKNATVITDPYDPASTGLKLPKITADIITISHDHKDHNYAKGIEESEITFKGPGEYELKNVKILGIGTFHDLTHGAERGKNTVFRIEIDNIAVVHLGDLGHKLSDSQVDDLGVVDILLVPVGGIYTLNAEAAAATVSQIEPKIIIPMHYKTEGMNENVFGKIDGVDVFLKEMGKTGIVPQEKLTISKEKLPIEPTLLVVE